MERIKRRSGIPYYKITLRWTPLIWIFIRSRTPVPQSEVKGILYFADIDGDLWIGTEYMCYGPATEDEINAPYYG